MQDQGKLAEAESFYKCALEVSAINVTQKSHVLNNLGTLLHEAGKYDDAINSYRLANECQSGFPDAHLNLTLSLLAI